MPCRISKLQARDEAHETRDARFATDSNEESEQRSNEATTDRRRNEEQHLQHTPTHPLTHIKRKRARECEQSQASFVEHACIDSRERERPTAPRVETHLQSRCCACGRGQRHIVTPGAESCCHTQRRGDPATRRLAITSQCSWKCSWESGEAEAPRARDTQRSRTTARSESSTLPNHRPAIESSSSSIQLA